MLNEFLPSDLASLVRSFLPTRGVVTWEDYEYLYFWNRTMEIILNARGVGADGLTIYEWEYEVYNDAFSERAKRQLEAAGFEVDEDAPYRGGFHVLWSNVKAPPPPNSTG